MKGDVVSVAGVASRRNIGSYFAIFVLLKGNISTGFLMPTRGRHSSFLAIAAAAAAATAAGTAPTEVVTASLMNLGHFSGRLGHLGHISGVYHHAHVGSCQDWVMLRLGHAHEWRCSDWVMP